MACLEPLALTSPPHLSQRWPVISRPTQGGGSFPHREQWRCPPCRERPWRCPRPPLAVAAFPTASSRDSTLLYFRWVDPAAAVSSGSAERPR
ncbi:Os09g0395400 [Oryza sativa Japonica Group]|uniref:Os09g0395400 protein n=2 Tax=Oryza sativa subsp. japonica TaxID=39947 RepID=A0A0P0XLE6_ORYSJ|nr:hypothetical protein EE612_047595 [Oryza sativa]KAF2916053.1 hypothetical protein DAI22_09g089400 [Oryza sativa Japonica Group]BAD26456.1 unknown protein [Oryza sativa Japonica Group]BAF25012.1 Os09g0395400 [Oryza sativa Japonica Group]BAT07931.1 Os09g0395400 [Oryza sativa Japonica Group]|eukprot:NP_001063098.1 Os09g0395400 [Oryza sativa Japonica Group]